MSELNLKPCPFCGSSDLKIENVLNQASDSDDRAVFCQNCFARGPAVYYDGQAVLLWNMRDEK